MKTTPLRFSFGALVMVPGLAALAVVAALGLRGQTARERDRAEAEDDIRARREQLDILDQTARGAAEDERRGAARNPEWIALFNGRSLSGWKALDGGAKFEARGGAIVGTVTAGVKRDSFLATKDSSFGDFIFECEVKCDAGLASGVQFRSLPADDLIPRVHGYRYEIDSTPRGLTGAIRGEGAGGWLAPKSGEDATREAWVAAHGDGLKPGEWNLVHLECRGAHMRTWLNGQVRGDAVDLTNRGGFFALHIPSATDAAAVGRQISFRNLRVRKF